MPIAELPRLEAAPVYEVAEVVLPLAVEEPEPEPESEPEPVDPAALVPDTTVVVAVPVALPAIVELE